MQNENPSRSAATQPRAQDAGLAVLESLRRKDFVAPFGRPRAFLGNRFVYAVISQRAHGLSVGINVNPDKGCNFDCPYCEVKRDVVAADAVVDLEVLGRELDQMLTLVHSGQLKDLPYFRSVPAELMALKGVALSGDGEPTLSPQ